VFLQRVSTLTRDIDIAILSVVRCVPAFYVIVCPSHGSPITLLLWVSNIFAKFRRDHPLQGRYIQVGY